MPDSTPLRDADGRTTLLRDEATVAVRAFVIGGTVLALIWVLMQIQVVTVAAFLGFAQAALLWPLMARLATKIPRPLAVLVSMLLYLGVIAALLWFTASQLGKAWPTLVQAVAGGIQQIRSLVEQIGVSVSDEAISRLQSIAADLLSGVGGLAVSSVSVVGTALTVLLLALFVTVFALVGGESLWKSTREALPSRWQNQAQASGEAVFRTGRLWLAASAISGTVEGALIGLGLWALGVPLAVPIAVLTFFAGFIPNIGAVLAGAVAVIVALFSGGLSTGIWALVLVIFVQQMQSNVLEPMFLSQAMQFHPIVTLLATVAGGLAFGFVGLLLTVPVAGAVYSGVKAWKGAREDSALAEAQ